MKLRTIVSPLLYLSAHLAIAAPVEDWQFDEAADTAFSGLSNSAGTAVWAGDVTNASTNGSGQLVFTVSEDDPETTEVDESTSDIFRNSDLSSPDQTTGKYELAFTYTAADLSDGDITGASVGFTARDDSNSDLFNVRLQKQGGVLRLQRRNSALGVNTDLDNFGVDTLTGPLAVRVIFDLDADTFAVFWTADGQSEKCQTNIPMDATGLELDRVRLYANTNATDWGATDQVDVDFLTLSTYTETPEVATAVEDWQFEDAAATGLNVASNAAGTANLGGAAGQAATDGSGNLLFVQGADASDNLFRNGDLTDPDQNSGKISLEWEYSAADLSGGDATGANMGFGIRDSNGDTPFLVRLHKQNDTLRLQTRVGSTNTDLENFGVTTLADSLYVKVTADLDNDTFDVFWRLGAGIGNCVNGIAMGVTGADFDQVRTFANTNTTDWGVDDEISVAYLVVSSLAAPSGDLTLSIANGPNAGEVTLIWPTSTPATAVLEASSDLGQSVLWQAVPGTPTVNGDNNELIVTLGVTGENYFQLRNP